MNGPLNTETSPTVTVLHFSIILLALTSYLIYKFFQSPRQGPPPPPPPPPIPSLPPSQFSNRHPPHLSNTNVNSSSCLLHGIVPFRQTHAHAHETSAEIISNRKERARIFARIFPGDSKPPNRGANVVVTVRAEEDPKCPRLRKGLVLFGTYYNLFVLVDGSRLEKEGRTREFIDGFRSELLGGGSTPDGLDSRIVPPHRIVMMVTTAGRVAFVRQLSNVELVIDGDEGVKKELERFGHWVLVYPTVCRVDGEASGSIGLGQFLIP